MSSSEARIYKIATREQWEAAEKSGVFEGAPIDLQDGYIHFSTAGQAKETLAKHFDGQKDLLLITVETSCYGDELKWEVSRGGDLFPHLYASLKVSEASRVEPIEDLADGGHILPETL